MESANREEAKRCLNKARHALYSGVVTEAERLAKKSLRLCSTKEAEDFLVSISNSGCKSSPLGGECSMQSPDEVHERCEHKNSPYSRNCNDYTDEQHNAVKRVLDCKDYYQILGVQRDASDLELKKQYKRLALTLHPDKNRAPRSDEAFKSVSNAYSVLSDATRRNHYDRFGEDGLRGPNEAAQPDLSADDLFRMFFGDSFGFADTGFMYSGQGNVFVYNQHMRPRFSRRARHYHHHRHHHRQEDGSIMHLCQLLPIVLILVVSISSTLLHPFLASSSPFSLQQNSEYTVKRITQEFKVPYYVKDNFDSEYLHQLRVIERDVIEQHVWDLKLQCNKDRFKRRGSKSTACTQLKKFTK